MFFSETAKAFFYDFDFDIDNIWKECVSTWPLSAKKMPDRKQTPLADAPELIEYGVYYLNKIKFGGIAYFCNRKIRHYFCFYCIIVEYNVYLLSKVVAPAQHVGLKASYIKNRNFDDNYLKKLIADYIKEYGKAERADLFTPTEKNAP